MKSNSIYLLSTFERYSPYTNKGVNGLVLTFPTASAAKLEPDVLFYTLFDPAVRPEGGIPDSGENQDSIIHMKFKLVDGSGHSIILVFLGGIRCMNWQVRNYL